MTATTLETDLATRWTPSEEQDALAHEALTGAVAIEYVYTPHVLVNKEHGWWTSDVEVVPIRGVFGTREAASAQAQAEAKRLHKETGKPTSGGYTCHWLPKQAPVFGNDGKPYQTHWAVYEDILAIFPVPSWSSRAK